MAATRRRVGIVREILRRLGDVRDPNWSPRGATRRCRPLPLNRKHPRITNMSSRPIPSLVWAGALVAGLLMLTLVALMFRMTNNMGRMTEQVVSMAADMGQMRQDVGALSDAVAGMNGHVANMDALARDVAGMRQSIDRMAGIVASGSEQMERMNPANMNPADLMQQMLQPKTRR
jgi:hypothetical protein